MLFLSYLSHGYITVTLGPQSSELLYLSSQVSDSSCFASNTVILLFPPPGGSLPSERSHDPPILNRSYQYLMLDKWIAT